MSHLVNPDCPERLAHNGPCLCSGEDKNLSPVPETESNEEGKTPSSTSSQPDANTLLWVRAAIEKCLSEPIGLNVPDLKSWVKVYEIKEKDKYDVELGWSVEYGLYSVEKYFFIKGMVIQQKICQKTCRL